MIACSSGVRKHSCRRRRLSVLYYLAPLTAAKLGAAAEALTVFWVQTSLCTCPMTNVTHFEIKVKDSKVKVTRPRELRLKIRHAVYGTVSSSPVILLDG